MSSGRAKPYLKIFLLILALVCGIGLFILGEWLASAIAFSSLHPARPSLEQLQQMGIARSPAEAGLEGTQVSIQTPDNCTLSAWWFPNSKADGKVVIVLHGIAGRSEFMFHQAGELRNQGYSVLCPDIRGHGKSGGFATMGWLDRKDLLQWKERIDSVVQQPSLVGLYGASYGAAIVLQTAITSDQFTCVVAISPFTDFGNVLKDQCCLVTGIRWIPWLTWRVQQHMAGLVGASSWKDLSALNLYQASTRIPATLLVHGDKDPVIGVDHSRRLAEACPKGVEYLEIKGAGHDDIYSRGGANMSETIHHFMAKNLK